MPKGSGSLSLARTLHLFLVSTPEKTSRDRAHDPLEFWSMTDKPTPKPLEAPKQLPTFGDIGEARVRHLELIQGTINRLATNSFAIKGWCLTLIVAVIGLAAKDHNTRFSLVALVPAVFFWGLDAYFLKQEQSFRRVYDRVRTMLDDDWRQSAFSMSLTAMRQLEGPTTVGAIAQPRQSWTTASVSSTLLGFYVPVVGVILGAALLPLFPQSSP